MSDTDPIERLKRKLYSRNLEPRIDVRSDIRPHSSPAPQAWGQDPTLHIPESMNTSAHPVLKKFLFAAILFFVVCVGIAAFVFFGGSNLITSTNVDIQVAGPTTVASGDEVDLSLSLINQNRAALQSAELMISYPSGAYADTASSTQLSNTTEDIGSIAAGSSLTHPEKVYLFGQKGETKQIVIALQYEVAGSNATFTKTKDYDVVIGSSPVIVDVSAPTTVTSGQTVTLTANITSNSSTVLKNMLVALNFPYGFTYQSSSLPLDQNIPGLWNIGDLQSGSKQTLTITGTLSAQNGEERTFQFNVGPDAGTHPPSIASVMANAAPTITVSKPLISADLTIAGKDSDTVPVAAGQGVSADLSFTNALATQLSNVSVVTTFSGNAFDPSSVQVGDGGFYQSSTDSISWDKNSLPDLAALNPGTAENMSFSLNTLQLSPNASNPFITISTTISGTQSSATGGVQQVSTTVSKTARVIANLVLKSTTLHGGPITNTGSTPPKAGTPTTYTAVWTLTNEWNDISGAKVSTTLPPYVDWTGQVSPTTANISYDANTRTIVWNPDSVSAGAGYSLPSRQVYFQLKLNPSLSQVGNAPALTGTITTIGSDTFSGANISFTTVPLTTAASDTNDQGIVTSP